MSLCDTCREPGRCCKKLILSSGGQPVTVWLDESVDAQVEAMGLPFTLLEMEQEHTDPESGRRYGVPFLTCPHLTTEGRCGVYEDRPQVCRDFEPGSSPLCVHYAPHVKNRVEEAAQWPS